jgi:hypothetical protein
MSQRSFIETLESRTLLSASPVLFNSTILADRATIRSDIFKFRAHAFACAAKLGAELRRIHRLTASGDTSLDASLLQLRTDSATLAAQLKADRQAEALNIQTDEATIRADIKQIHKDKHDAEALATDDTKLTNDRITLQTDLLAALDARITARQNAQTTIATDTQAIVTAAQNDSQATTKFTAAVTKFATDRTACLDKLTTDLTAIAAARTKLVTDLTAAQST